MRAFLFSAIILPCIAAPAHAQAENQNLPNCNISRSWDVIFHDTGETVRLGMEMTSEAGMNGADLTLTLADGTVVDLGTGRKYIDDYGPDDVPGCDDLVSVATGAALTTIRGRSDDPNFLYTPPYLNMSDIDRALNIYERCETDPGCTAGWQQDLDGMQAWRDANRDEYERLLRMDAPLITVTRSAYFADTLALDRDTGTVVTLFYEGC